ncbi:MAG: STAS domain-containing protein [Myxococcales bacterium]|nr:STAS domain-containing protein [Myxococcales bacterium]
MSRPGLAWTPVLQAVLEGTAGALGEDFLRALVRHLADALAVQSAMMTELLDAERGLVRTLGFWSGGRFLKDFTYTLAGTPCERVFAGGECFCERQVQAHFPGDDDLVKLGAESYLGVVLHDRQGRPLGHLAVLDAQPMSPADLEVTRGVLRIFAARAGAELERARIERDLRATQEALERTVSALSTPMLRVWRGVVAVPLIGALDLARARRIGEALLTEIAATKARFAILDLTGADDLDAMTADRVLKIGQAAAMLGTEAILSGIRPSLAQTLVFQPESLERLRDFQTFRTMQEALAHCMRRLGA